MPADEIHVDDIGTAFTVTIYDGSSVVDVSAATTKQILFRKPDRTLLTKNASFVNSGSDGKIRYTSVSGDLDQIGDWQLQAFIVIGSNQWHTDLADFQVHRNV